MKSHQQLIAKYADWDLAQERLKKFQTIGSHFDISTFSSAKDTPPYYCHPIGWRLATWSDNAFHRLNTLLALARSIPGWKAEFGRLKSQRDFGFFWALSWQLECALYFKERGAELSWTREGPDLIVTGPTDRFYVECYTYQKTFAIEQYVEEIMKRLSSKIHVSHKPFQKFTRPHDLDNCLDTLFKPFLNRAFLSDKLRQTEHAWPVPIPVPDGLQNLIVSVHGDDHSTYVPGSLGAGNPDLYLSHAFEEAVNNKRSSNKLGNHRPNVLMINFLVSNDFEAALNRARQLEHALPSTDLGDTLDAVVGCVCGIDGKWAGPIVQMERTNHPAGPYFRDAEIL